MQATLKRYFVLDVKIGRGTKLGSFLDTSAHFTLRFHGTLCHVHKKSQDIQLIVSSSNKNSTKLIT